MTLPVPFEDNDQGYVDWLRQHPQGYVLNANRKPNPGYLPLHRATCWTLQRKVTTKTYIKVCADTIADLDAWAHRQTGSYPSRCGHCTP